jgi:beta-glucanase (GH16 family)
VPVGLGLWPAFWMIGDFVDGREWPAVGEIDIMEYVNDMTTLHANGWGDTDIGTTWSFTGRLPVDPGFAQNWHVYSVEWTSESLVFAVDDDPFHSIDRAGLQPGQVWRFDQPQAILVNLAVGGDFPGAVGDDSVFPAEMHVDFIRVYDSELFARG